ncbi:MAG: hypothetical protein WCS37_05630 [Chloroflexota bacterium]|nr:hypothetical protein [Chloroflexota bacterium]
MSRRDYDKIYWGFNRPNFDNYDEGDESPEDIEPPSSRDHTAWGFGQSKDSETKTGSQVWEQLFSYGPKMGTWAFRRSLDAVIPALRRSLEEIPGWGSPLETEPDENLDKMIAGLEQQETRLIQRLGRARHRLEQLRMERVRRERRQPRTSPDFGVEPTDSSDTDVSML